MRFIELVDATIMLLDPVHEVFECSDEKGVRAKVHLDDDPKVLQHLYQFAYTRDC